MTEIHDLFVRALAVPAAKTSQKKRKRKSRDGDSSKWPRYALIFDTETRVTADQSLTFGVFRICELKNEKYRVIREGLFYADDLAVPRQDIQTSAKGQMLIAKCCEV